MRGEPPEHCHDLSSAGHPGVEKTNADVDGIFSWLNIREEIASNMRSRVSVVLKGRILMLRTEDYRSLRLLLSFHGDNQYRLYPSVT